MMGLLCGLSLALWDRVGYWVPCLKQGKTNKTAAPVLSTPLAFPKRTDNGSAKRSGVSGGTPVPLPTHSWSRPGSEEGEVRVSLPSGIRSAVTLLDLPGGLAIVYYHMRRSA